MKNWELVVVSNELLTTTHKYPQIQMFALVFCRVIDKRSFQVCCTTAT